MVKLLKEKYMLEAEQGNFEEDAIALTKFSHPYVQSLFGVCVDGLPLCLVFEFSEHDECLQQFLIESGRGHCSIHRRADLHNSKPKLSNIDQISMAKQIANGMEYLADKGYVHRELCTKNCIIGKGMVVKISNLGFSWKGPNSDYFSLDENERAGYPVRWLPPETLQCGVFKEETDIWSFGVVLWEIYSSGLTPYYGMNDDEVISLVEGGDTLPCPKECPNEMYEVMQGCWSSEPTERPRFNSIHQRISSLFNGVPV
ncbi:muscle, skeletal receptor tyrosine-protein kinase-like [Orbicella faveolata]|nr:muscle, skeletal receptor tyrosine-protein kinase-like [Orbicella faveolata]